MHKLLLILYPPRLKRKKCLATPLEILSPPHARQVVYFCPLTQRSSKQYRCPAARKRKADECKVRDKCDQGAKKVRMGVTDLNNGVIDQASGGVTAVMYTLWQSLFRLHPGNGWNQISMIKGTKIPSIFNKSPFLQLIGCPTRSFRRLFSPMLASGENIPYLESKLRLDCNGPAQEASSLQALLTCIP